MSYNNLNINFFIWSKNRALQLDFLLRTIKMYAPGLWPPTVIYACDTNPFCMGYEILKPGYPDINWVPQTPEAPVMKTLLFNNLDKNKMLTSFLVDDTCFYNPLPFFTLDEGWAYAPRLGRNCTFCFNVGRPQRVPVNLWREVGDPAINGDLDFDCTMSNDGHIYLTHEIVPHLESIGITHPFDIETQLYPIVRPKLKFAEKSCLFGIPHNQLGPNWMCRAMGRTAKDLNDRYLQGYRVQIEAMDYSNVNGVHVPLDYHLYHPTEPSSYPPILA